MSADALVVSATTSPQCSKQIVVIISMLQYYGKL